MTPEASVASGVIFCLAGGRNGSRPGALGVVRQAREEETGGSGGGCAAQGGSRTGGGGAERNSAGGREQRAALAPACVPEGQAGAEDAGGCAARGEEGGESRNSGRRRTVFGEVRQARSSPQQGGEAGPTGRAAPASFRRGDQTSKSISRSSRVRDFQESCPGMTASATPRFIS